jgi:hypothetical protein
MAKTAIREVGGLIKLGWMTPRPGFQVSRVHGDQLRWSPYLAIDHFYMSQPVFPSHPHAGFSAVTLIFEDSENTFVNRDSKGDMSLIRPGTTIMYTICFVLRRMLSIPSTGTLPLSMHL